jgi:hypothetical protein
MPRWWGVFRRVVVFLLGCAVIVDSLIGDKGTTGKLVVGLLMVGVLPLDDLVKLVARRRLDK